MGVMVKEASREVTHGGWNKKRKLSQADGKEQQKLSKADAELCCGLPHTLRSQEDRFLH